MALVRAAAHLWQEGDGRVPLSRAGWREGGGAVRCKGALLRQHVRGWEQNKGSEERVPEVKTPALGVCRGWLGG